MREPDTCLGRLVRLFDIGLHAAGELAYHPKRLHHKRVSTFRDWLLREAAEIQRLA